MSSLAARLRSPRRPAGAALPRARPRVLALPVALADGPVCAAVALVLAGVVFGASGGNELERTTYTEIALMLGGATLAALALLSPAAGERRLPGAWTLVGLAALAALTAVSVTWSVLPSQSWVEANRMLAYVAAFAGALALVRLAPERWPGVIGGVALSCVVVAASALLTKVFPGALAPDETFGRLRAPFDYWNATGLMPALGVPALLWLAAKRSGNQALNALAYPGLGLAFVCVLLSFSRGALLALVVGLAFWFAIVPLRLRAAAALVVSGATAALVIAWAFSADALTTDDVALPARVEAGHELGFALALMTICLLVAGLAIGFVAANRTPTRRTRRRVGTGLVAAVALAAVLGLVALASAPGGIDGQISKVTDPAAATPSNTPQRLTATASVRSRYWTEGIEVWRANEWLGTGAGSFNVARTRYRTGNLEVRQAHSYVVETMAALGLLGLAVSLALLVAWLLAAGRATGLRRGDRGLPMDAERVGLLTLTAVVVTFGVHSLIDWTWLVPGTAVTALVCAAWVAGRGPLRDRLAAGPAGRRPRHLELAPTRARAAGALLVLVVGVAAAWAAFQPVRSVHAIDAAYARLDIGQQAAAVDIARIATRRNPLSADALFELASIQTATGRPVNAEATLERAVELQPADAEAWRRLGEHRVLALDQDQRGLAALRAAYYLDPESSRTENAFLLLRRQLAMP
ncbi:MAG: hypothetical protein AVDCRST_MAG30-4196 [uncultured Solirubrobacteraceae bacterium]|uniref:O-antigen ligase-related domain-containing protein n=1 Tax=uncultured Solirubrobacteraceae bacterium TaxID=1162706 RepID=A0A6J4TYZ6_9ACTN|nr:MAG: hypothetical protein AVDCRST_MAG30-4196 [uncultured Solirubrobacteraceae bacterium]